MNNKNKKHQQLKMNAGTASHRLSKDLLYDFAIKAGHICFRCNEPLTRETFSIDHRIPWLDSDKPIEKFFDLDNVAFSHSACNSKAIRRPSQKYFSKEERKEARKI